MEVFIDGACKNNGKLNAKSSYAVFWADNDPKNFSGPVPGNQRQTNNVGEMFAALKCLEQIHELNLDAIIIKSDSEYLVRGITSDIKYWMQNNWKLKSTGNDVKNKDIWQQIFSLSSTKDIQFIHIARDSEDGQIKSDGMAKAVLAGKTVNANGVQRSSPSNDCDAVPDR